MDQAKTIETPKKIVSFQALRALSFIGIFLGHALFFVSWPELGVSVFFVMSGFVMIYTYYDKEMNSSLIHNIKFSIRKISKLYPLHIVTMIMAVLLTIEQGGLLDSVGLLKKIVCNVFLIQTWIPMTSFCVSLNGVAWYLSVTLFLYFCFPWIMKGIKYINNFVKLLILSCIILALQLLFAAFSINVYGIDGTFYKWATYCFPVFRLGDFIIGCNLGYIFKQHNCLKKISVYKGSILEIMAIGLTILICWAVKQETFLVPLKIMQNSTTAYIIIAACWVYLFSVNRGIITKFFTNKVLIWIGDISAYLFLIHYVITQYTITILRHFQVSLSNEMRTVVILLEFLVTVLCTILYMKLEKRVRVNSVKNV